MNYKLNPSDLTFLYDGCKHCFVQKVRYGIPQPSKPIPGVFSIIASLQKNHYNGRRTEDFCPQLPPGKVNLGEKKICSSMVKFDGIQGTCQIVGRFDITAELDDKAYAVMDFKTGNPSDEKTDLYSRQLHAYAFSLENPAEGALGLSPVTHLGLLYFTPDRCEYVGDDRQVLEGEMRWVEVKRDDKGFLSFLREVISLLDGPMPSPNPDTCDWCKYRSKLIGGQPSSTGLKNTGVNPPVPACPQCGGSMRLRKGRFGDFWGCQRYPTCRGTLQA